MSRLLARLAASLFCTLQDQLFVVKLMFSNGRQIISTFSLKPALPSAISKRGLRRDQYLEIDPVLARTFGIMEGDEVGERKGGVRPSCRNLHAVCLV